MSGLIEQSPALRAAAQQLRAAFTMVELLVIIAIITVLVGLLAPGLAAVRAAGQSTVCQTNLRQMAMAAQNYAAVYDAFPAAIRYEQAHGGVTIIAWDWITTFDGQVISPGPLWASTDNPGEVQQCPSYYGATNFADPYTGYNYNATYIGGEGTLGNWGWEKFRPGVPSSGWRRTTETAVFGDGGITGGIVNKLMRGPMNTGFWGLGAVYAGAQAFRHRGSTNVAYLDGHIGSPTHPHQGGLATASLLENMEYPRNGFLSDDDRAYDPR